MPDESFDPEDDEMRMAAMQFLAGQVEEEDESSLTLRWTPTTLLIDVLNSAAMIMEGVATLFSDQARSLAARATLKEELKDDATRLELRAQARTQMKLEVLDDLSVLPEATD